MITAPSRWSRAAWSRRQLPSEFLLYSLPRLRRGRRTARRTHRVCLGVPGARHGQSPKWHVWGLCIAPRVVAGKEVAERADAGVAVENVDCPVRLEGEVDKVLAGLGIAHVAAKADRFPPAACSSSANCKTSLPRAASTTHAPSSVKTRVIPAPMPLEGPVIMAIFPSSLPMLTSSL